MHSKKKICLIIHSLGIGGMERVMSELANNFSNREGVDVHLILIGKTREVSYALSESVTIHRPNFKFSNKRRNLDTLRTLLFIRKTVRRINPDTVLSFGEMWNNLVLLALKGLSCNVYVSDRSQPDKYLGRLQNLLRDKLYPNAAGYIAQTEKAADICFEKKWNQNIEVIGNPVRKVQVDSETEKENIVLTVGRLIPTKHIDQLIMMFEELSDPEWKLVIVGGDAKRMNLLEELQKLIDGLGAEDRIFLEGEKKDVDSYYNRAKIFAFTSSSEGFPNVIGEALSAGLPVISYDCMAGPADMIVDGENGYLISLYDKKEFKKKLRHLMEDKQQRENMGRKSREVIQKYSIDVISEKYYSFITSGDE